MDTEFVTDLEAVLNSLEQRVRARKIRVKGGPEKAGFLLLLSAMENSRAFIHVLRSPYSYSAISNGRSGLEALVDFFALANDPSHFHSMEQAFLRQKKGVLASSIRATKALLPDASASLKAFERDLSETHLKLSAERKVAKKAKGDLIAEHLDKTGLVSSIWSMVCDVTHNNINALAARHIVMDTAGAETIRMNAQVDAELAESLCAILSALFRDVLPFLERTAVQEGDA